mgnify:CR=1 FL=1
MSKRASRTGWKSRFPDEDIYLESDRGILYQGHVLDVLRRLPGESVDCIVTSPPYWCYAEGHEILTDRGWKDISRVKAGDRVLSVNPENMELEWARVTATGKWFYKGEMIEFKNTHIDLLVTPNHKMYVYYQHVGNGVKPREDVGYFQSTKDRKGKFFVEARGVRGGYITPKTGFKWKGREPQYFVLPSMRTLYNKQDRHYPPLKIKIDDWVAFLGIWIAEGSVRGSKGGKKKNYAISIKQKEPNASKIRELLRRLPFDFNETKDSRGIVRFETSHKQLWAYLRKLGNSHTKYVPREIKELSPRLLKIFLKWYLMGDGCVKGRGSHKEVSCYTVSERLRGDLQEISLKVGSNMSSQGENKLVFLRRGTVKLKETMRATNYEGMIYGVEVEKNHTLCIKRNNKIVFSGNSLRNYGEETNTVWGGDPNCEHEWGDTLVYKERGSTGGKTAQTGTHRRGVQGTESIRGQFCRKCGAWHGQLGLEPTLDLYLVHLWQISDELYRVLKPTGVVFWNHGDSYGTSGKYSTRASMGGATTSEGPFGGKRRVRNRDTVPVDRTIPPKCMAMQNYRFILGLIDIDYRILVEWRAMGRPDGELEEMLRHPRIQEILRNSIIWHKPNHMPSSVKDRFTNAYEPVFMLVKNVKPVYYYNTKTGLMVDKKPLGVKGVEGVDWDYDVELVYNKETESYERRMRYDSSGKPKKISHWRSIDYWFDLDAVRVPHKESSIERAKYGDGQGLSLQSGGSGQGYGGPEFPHCPGPGQDAGGYARYGRFRKGRGRKAGCRRSGADKLVIGD